MSAVVKVKKKKRKKRTMGGENIHTDSAMMLAKEGGEPVFATDIDDRLLNKRKKKMKKKSMEDGASGPPYPLPSSQPDEAVALAPSAPTEVAQRDSSLLTINPASHVLDKISLGGRVGPQVDNVISYTAADPVNGDPQHDRKDLMPMDDWQP